MAVPSCTSCLSPVSQNTEGGRIARLLESARASARAEALAKARGFANQGPCRSGDCGSYKISVQDAPPPLESIRLQAVVNACYASRNVVTGCVPESVRIARVNECTLRESTNPFNPETRFSEFRGPFIPPVCPPIPQEALNANVPKNQMRNCPLPNKPDNPVLPG